MYLSLQNREAYIRRKSLSNGRGTLWAAFPVPEFRIQRESPDCNQST